MPTTSKARDHRWDVPRRMNMVLEYYDGQIIPRNECGLNSLTFILQLRKIPVKTSIRKLTQPGIELRPRWMTGNDVNPRPLFVISVKQHSTSDYYAQERDTKRWFHNDVLLQNLRLFQTATLNDALVASINGSYIRVTFGRFSGRWRRTRRLNSWLVGRGGS